MPIAFSVITDEISPDPADGIAFALEEGLDRVDVRSIDGVNFLSLDSADQKRVARQIKDAGLHVGCLATPLLKWPAPGKSAGNSGDQFGFDAKGRSIDEIYASAFAAADVLGTRNLRIFSYLTYAGFKLADLEAPYIALLKLAERHDMVLHVENEPVCNVLSVADLGLLMQAWKHPRLKGLLDIANSAHAGKPTTPLEVATVMPWVDQVHFKDYAGACKAYVATGEGDIPYAELLVPCCKAAVVRDLVWTIETHVPDDQPGATRRSLQAVRGLATG
ncbi:MAG: sugar phosphate isomerase/epimerase family protein [Hyphomicrobiaceae bacterium]